MRCETARDLICVGIDGDLSATRTQELRDHVADCADCRNFAREMNALRDDLRRFAGLLAPPTLRADLSAALDAAERDQLPFQRRPIVRQAMAMAAVCLLSVFGTWTFLREAPPADARAEVLTAHIRSLLQDSPIQIASSDSHTVRPWFNGRVEFAPVVRDLTADGFPLIGGRLDYLAGRRVAALVYKRRLHVVNVFIWPTPKEAHDTVQAIQTDEYSLLTWTRGGLRFWAVSDLNPMELAELRALL